MAKALYNRLNRKELKDWLVKSSDTFQTISFYRYYNLSDPKSFRDALFLKLDSIGVKGRIYLASEGINGQISVPEEQLNAFKAILNSYDWLQNLRLNFAIEHGKSFYQLKIKVREKIVADGIEDKNFDVTKKGLHVNALEFNELTDKEETLLVDMRNHYEHEVGHFEGAILPDVENFRDSLPKIVEDLKEYKDKPIVMYCTGGIRCEKASAYFKYKGFSRVYQLDGGIIQYAHEVENQGLKNKFRGKNFVFDERLGESISNEVIAKCHHCAAPADQHYNCMNEACHLLHIHCENCHESLHGYCSELCQSFDTLPDELKKEAKNDIRLLNLPYLKGKRHPEVVQLMESYLEKHSNEN